MSDGVRVDRHRMLVTRVWAKERPFGAELAEIALESGTLAARGVAIGTEPTAYRLEYQLTTDQGYVTSRLSAVAEGAGWRRQLVLERANSGVWSCTSESEGALDLPPPGGDLSQVKGALDCDLGLSPLTNTMPVLRHGLHIESGPLDFLMAWISVPDLAVYRSRQRYAFVRREPNARIVHYASLDSAFAVDISFDDHGLVLDYPGLARVVEPPT